MFRARGSANGGVVIAQAYASAVRTSLNSIVSTPKDSDYVTLGSVTVPGGIMGPNSKLLIIVDWSYSNSVNTKTMAVDFGGVNIGASTGTTSDAFKVMLEVQNMGSLTAQKTHNAHTFGSAGARISGTVNTVNDAVLDFKCKWSIAVVETITLIGYSVVHYPGR